MKKKVKIFTDGSCLKNPGPGGCSAIIHYKEHNINLNVGYYFTTNNRMELMAAIISLEIIKFPCQIIFYTDSQYVRQGITKWMKNWKKTNWQTYNKKKVKNIDLWYRLYFALIPHIIYWHWIKGHAGNFNNEYCDKLARNAAKKPSNIDVGYLI